MPKIAIAGFQHETNSFGLKKATFRDFEIADSWPGLLRGEDVITGTLGINLPIAGFIEATRKAAEIELVPIVWCAAEPSAHFTTDAFGVLPSSELESRRDWAGYRATSADQTSV